MPRAPRYCPYPGCTQHITTTRYCAEHTRTGWVAGGKPIYQTPEYRAWRKAVLERDHWRCQIKGPRCQGKATQADHRLPLARGGAPFDVDNGQAACPTCHQDKTQREAAEALRRQ